MGLFSTVSRNKNNTIKNNNLFYEKENQSEVQREIRIFFALLKLILLGLWFLHPLHSVIGSFDEICHFGGQEKFFS